MEGKEDGVLLTIKYATGDDMFKSINTLLITVASKMLNKEDEEVTTSDLAHVASQVIASYGNTSK